MRQYLIIGTICIGLLHPPSAVAGLMQGKDIVEQDCATCHNLSAPAANNLTDLLKMKAPDLFHAGSKFNRDWLVAWLQSPTPIRRAGVMYLNHITVEKGKDKLAQGTINGCPVKLKPQEANRVADYLMTLKGPSFKVGVVEGRKRFSKRKAMRLFRKQLPCVGCHTVRWGKRIIGGISGPNLTEAGNRLNPDWVYAFLENPQYWAPKAWMPKIELSHKKRKLLTQLISSMKNSGSREFPPGKLYGNTPVTPFSAYAFPQGEEGGRAERNYRLYCVQCHGSQGNGNGINDAAGGLSVSSRNHVYAKQMSKLTDDEIRDAITGGGDAVEKSGLMPAWGSTLANDEIAELVRYLRKLCACEYEATD